MENREEGPLNSLAKSVPTPWFTTFALRCLHLAFRKHAGRDFKPLLYKSRLSRAYVQAVRPSIAFRHDTPLHNITFMHALQFADCIHGMSKWCGLSMPVPLDLCQRLLYSVEQHSLWDKASLDYARLDALCKSASCSLPQLNAQLNNALHASHSQPNLFLKEAMISLLDDLTVQSIIKREQVSDAMIRMGPFSDIRIAHELVLDPAYDLPPPRKDSCTLLCEATKCSAIVSLASGNYRSLEKVARDLLRFGSRYKIQLDTEEEALGALSSRVDTFFAKGKTAFDFQELVALLTSMDTVGTFLFKRYLTEKAFVSYFDIRTALLKQILKAPNDVHSAAPLWNLHMHYRQTLIDFYHFMFTCSLDGVRQKQLPQIVALEHQQFEAAFKGVVPETVAWLSGAFTCSVVNNRDLHPKNILMEGLLSLFCGAHSHPETLFMDMSRIWKLQDRFRSIVFRVTLLYVSERLQCTGLSRNLIVEAPFVTFMYHLRDQGVLSEVFSCTHPFNQLMYAMLFAFVFF